MILPYVMLNIWSSPMTLVLLQVWVLCSDQFPQIENMSKTCNLDQRQNIEKKLMISIKSDNDATAAPWKNLFTIFTNFGPSEVQSLEE